MSIRSRLKRDITIITAAVVGVAGLIGTALGWLAHQLLDHLHHEAPSGHPWRVHRDTPREVRG